MDHHGSYNRGCSMLFSLQKTRFTCLNQTNFWNWIEIWRQIMFKAPPSQKDPNMWRFSVENPFKLFSSEGWNLAGKMINQRED